MWDSREESSYLITLGVQHFHLILYKAETKMVRYNDQWIWPSVWNLSQEWHTSYIHTLISINNNLRLHTWLILAQGMSCYLMAPSYYLKQYSLVISEVVWHSPKGIFTENAILDMRKLLIYNYRGQWVITNWRYMNEVSILASCTEQFTLYFDTKFLTLYYVNSN